MATSTISVIVPTIGRPLSLERLLRSLVRQSHPVAEVIVADGSADRQVAAVVEKTEWQETGLLIRLVNVVPPHAVRQRQAAISVAIGDLLLLLDDDVQLEPICVEELVKALANDPSAVAVMADLSNHTWPSPTRAWRRYLSLVHGIRDGAWEGRLIGPLLRFGYANTPVGVCRTEWFGSGNTLIRRWAFERAGGFSEFFLRRSTMNEDVDLAIRVSHYGAILFCPSARLAHFHDPIGRCSPGEVAEDDLFNRFHILRSSCKASLHRALVLVLTFAFVETASNVLGSLRHKRFRLIAEMAWGRIRALAQIMRLAWSDAGTRSA